MSSHRGGELTYSTKGELGEHTSGQTRGGVTNGERDEEQKFQPKLLQDVAFGFPSSIGS